MKPKFMPHLLNIFNLMCYNAGKFIVLTIF